MTKKYFLNVDLHNNKEKSLLKIIDNKVYYERINNRTLQYYEKPIFLCYVDDIDKYIECGFVREEINYGEWASDKDIVDILDWYRLNFNHNSPPGACVVLEKYKEHKGIHQDE